MASLMNVSTEYEIIENENVDALAWVDELRQLPYDTETEYPNQPLELSKFE